MLTVATVLRSGAEYTAEHVLAARAGVARHLKAPHRFVCLTDTPIPDVNCILLAHNWPGWWSKIELFRPGLFDGPVLFSDLDVMFVGPLDDLVGGHLFTVLRNMWVEPGHPRIGSGLMAWDSDLSGLYRKFRADPDRHMREHVTRDSWGDQGFIQRHGPTADRWQVKHPGRVVSYKVQCRAGVPAGASIVVFHGQPRPWATDLWGPYVRTL